MSKVDRLWLLKSYQYLGHRLVPLNPRSKILLVKWKDYQLTNNDLLRYLAQGSNWAIRCGERLHVLDFDDGETYQRFIQGQATFKDKVRVGEFLFNFRSNTVHMLVQMPVQIAVQMFITLFRCLRHTSWQNRM